MNVETFATRVAIMERLDFRKKVVVPVVRRDGFSRGPASLQIVLYGIGRDDTIDKLEVVDRLHRRGFHEDAYRVDWSRAYVELSLFAYASGGRTRNRGVY